jgi:hypothetical protein
MNSPSDPSSSQLNKPSSEKLPLFSVHVIVIAAVVWGTLALLFFLLFSTKVPGADGVLKRAEWYLVGTYLFEMLSYLGAAILCFRNWRSPNIVSGRNVWLGIALGTLSYFLGDLLLGYWEVVLDLRPDVSLGDVFFITSYLCLGWGIFLAVKSRRLNLESWQWLVVTAIAVLGSLLAWLISYATPPNAGVQSVSSPSTVQQVASTASPAATNSLQKSSPKGTDKAKAPTLSATPAGSPANTGQTQAAWAVKLADQLEPLAPIVDFLYVIFDILLLILATMLILAFWGGRFIQSWRMIAAATFSLYIADTWLKYAQTYVDNYQTGALLEVFWVWSGVLFAIGAALEYDTSSRSRRTSGRKRA